MIQCFVNRYHQMYSDLLVDEVQLDVFGIQLSKVYGSCYEITLWIKYLLSLPTYDQFQKSAFFITWHFILATLYLLWKNLGFLSLFLTHSFIVPSLYLLIYFLIAKVWIKFLRDFSLFSLLKSYISANLLGLILVFDRIGTFYRLFIYPCLDFFPLNYIFNFLIF